MFCGRQWGKQHVTKQNRRVNQTQPIGNVVNEYPTIKAGEI